eukprot:787314-Alexandrium_andersonii.AAC.1
MAAVALARATDPGFDSDPAAWRTSRSFAGGHRSRGDVGCARSPRGCRGRHAWSSLRSGSGLEKCARGASGSARGSKHFPGGRGDAAGPAC